MDRRDFLRVAGSSSLLGLAGAPVLGLLTSGVSESSQNSSKIIGKKYGMVIDLNKCDGCKKCMDVCRKENNVPLFGNEKIDNYWIRVGKLTQKFPNAKTKNIPLMCNHCEDPFCVKVCLVKASFKRDDGIVLVDEHRCIGCRYCMVVCPYKARSFVFKHSETHTNPELPKRQHGVVEKCTFCFSRVDKGLSPVCVDACPNKAMLFGDLNDPQSDVASIVASGNTQRIRVDLKSGPQVYYVGL